MYQWRRLPLWAICFELVLKPAGFLAELHRILKDDGRLVIEDGHQSRDLAKKKILASKLWTITEETKGWMVCIPEV